MGHRNRLALAFTGAALLVAASASQAADPRVKQPQPPIDEVALKGTTPTGVPTSSPTNTVMYSSTNVGGPQWDRPIGCGPTISGLGPVRYHVQAFVVDANGNYDINSVQSYDGYIHLYANSFDPNPPNQPTNCIASNDDGGGGIGTSDILGQALTAGTPYFLVTSAFGNGDEGTFTNTLSGPGNISLGGNGPDLALTATSAVTTADAGDQFDIDLQVTNNGPGDATGVDVTASLSANLSIVSATCGSFPWAIGTLADGASVSCTVTVELASCGPASFAATVAGDDLDDASNNSDAVNVNANVVSDPSYEGGSPSAAWTEASTNFGTPLCTVGLCGTGTGTGPRTGNWWAWFGGFAGFEEGSTTQSIVIPTGDSALLSFWIEAFVCSGSASDFVEVTIDGTQVFSLDATNAICGTLGYSEHTVDVTSFADGNSHTLEVHSITNSGVVTNFFVDDISLVTCTGVEPPVPPDAPGPPGIPTLDGIGLGVLAALLALGGAFMMRRRREV